MEIQKKMTNAETANQKKLDQIKKDRKTYLKALQKQMLKSDAHITVLIDEFGKVKMYTDMADKREISYTLLYIAKDLQGEVEDLEKQMADTYKEEFEKIKPEEIEEVEEEKEV